MENNTEKSNKRIIREVKYPTIGNSIQAKWRENIFFKKQESFLDLKNLHFQIERIQLIHDM